MVAPRIIWRHIFREISLYTFLGLSVFAVILVAATLLQKLEGLLTVGVGLGVMLELTLYFLPSYLAYVIPTAFLFGVLLAFTRMSADGETVAMRAGGIGVARITPPVLLLGAIASAVCAFVAFDLEPRSHYNMKTVMKQLMSQTSLIEPGEVNDLGGEKTIYVERLGDEDCPLRNVFLSDFADDQRPLYISALCGRVGDSGLAARDLALTLEKGAIHFAETDIEASARYRRIAFDTMTTEFDIQSALVPGKRLQHYTIEELWRMDPETSGFGAPRVRTERQRRLALPAGALVLGLLAIPLGIRPSRGGRSSGTVTALLVMALYWTLFLAGELAGKRDLVPAFVAMWLPNAFIAILACVLLFRSTRGEV